MRNTLIGALALLACATLCNAAGGAFPVGGSAPYRVWANYWCSAADKADCEPSQYDIGAWNRTQTGGGCYTNGCKPWSQGRFPVIYDNGEMVNGGIPQRANLTLHLELLAKGVVEWLPDPEWEVHAVIDFEAWSPIWYRDGSSDNWHGKRYRVESIKYVKEQLPNVTNETVIEAIAKVQFEEAGVRFFAETLKLLNKLRPKALWGFYGFPQAVSEPCVSYTSLASAQCGYENPLFGPGERALNDIMAPVWRETRAFYPSVYLFAQSLWPYSVWQIIQQANTRGLVNETTRLSNTYTDGTAPILPFYWPLYHNGTTPVDRHDLLALIRNAYLPPLSTQLIVWDGSGPMAKQTGAVMRALDGPVLRAATALATQCSAQHCSGRGWCDATAAFAGLASGAVSSDAATCTCYPGNTGASCNVTAPRE